MDNRILPLPERARNQTPRGTGQLSEQTLQNIHRIGDDNSLDSVCRKTRKLTVRLSKIAAFALIVGATSSMSVSQALAASDCPKSVELADWGENATGDISVASGGSCLFPIRMPGTVSSSDIFQKPVHGKLKKLNVTTYEYKAKARYKGSDTFAIKATGQGPTASGTTVITVHATIK
ncbi:hypothetical protein [Bradyrhizobium sp. Ash2021]|uniref:hypothetical protein n=1 Tax=Bradyrhizobium sp. Ash2021 TaxID=2954771 RepID=UPI0028168ED4|nr:hypothetical protein [Bradyrhizobium sp. Ash2021]WMT78234.1 hypothetical protein NL528_18645 [Bradyrhizobium sp. Ash2021]